MVKFLKRLLVILPLWLAQPASAQPRTQLAPNLSVRQLDAEGFGESAHFAQAASAMAA